MVQKTKRDWQPREMRMVSEYLQANYSQYPWQTRVRLGSIPDKLRVPQTSLAEERLAGVWRRWADAIVIKPDQLIVIEAGIKPEPGDVSKLELYGRLIRHTPEFEPFNNLPVALELVYAMVDEFLETFARERGIRVVYYEPVWLKEYLSILYPHERRASLSTSTDLEKLS